MSENFEDLSHDRMRDARTFHSSVQRAVEQQSIRFLHIGEAPELDDWTRVLNSLREKYALRITVTGSNASLFAGESLTYLAGRYIAVDVLPLSLGEYRTSPLRRQSGNTGLSGNGSGNSSVILNCSAGSANTLPLEVIARARYAPPRTPF